MSSDVDILDRCQQVLAELMESDLEVVRHAKAHLLAQDEPAQVDGAMRSYAHASRALRQSVTLNQKLVRDIARDGREAAASELREALLRPRPVADDPPRRRFPRDIAAADQRAGEVRTAVRPVIWAQGLETSAIKADHHIEGELYRRLEDWIADERCEDTFLAQSLDEQVAEYCEEMDLDPDNTGNWRDLEEPDAGIIRLALANHREYSGKPVWFESG